MRSSSTFILFSAGKNHVVDAGAFRGQDFLLNSADGQHIAAQRDFSGHGSQRAHRTSVSSETSAVAMVTPADGPSLGIAPAGT